MLRILLLLIVFSGLASILQAQNDSQSSVLADIRASKRDTNRVSLLLKAGRYHLLKPGNEKKDLDSAFSFFRPALALSRALHADQWIMESLKWNGDSYLEGEELGPGEACFQEVINYYRRTGEKRREAETWQRLGACIPRRNEVLCAENARVFGQARLAFACLHDTLNEIEMLKRMADANLLANRPELAEQELLEVLSRYRALHYTKLQYTFDLLRAVYKIKGQPQLELFYVIEMLKSMESTHDTALAWHFYYVAGTTYFAAGMYDRSLTCCRKALDAAKYLPKKNKAFRVTIYYNVTQIIAEDLLQKDSAKSAYLLVSDLVRRYPPTDYMQRETALSSLGRCLMGLGQYQEAERNFIQLAALLDSFTRKSVEITLFTTPEYIWQDYQAISHLYVLLHQYAKADYYFKKIPVHPSYPLAVSTRLEFQLVHSQIDSCLGDYTSALRYFELYKALNDSLYSADKSRQIQELQIKYETDQKDKDLKLQSNNILVLTKQTQLQQTQAEKSRLLRNTMIGGISLLLLLVGVIYNRYRLKQRSMFLLEDKQAEIETKNTGLERLLHDNEWLLREVHHRVKNNLQVVMSLLSSQCVYLKDEKALSAVRESQYRVQAMSLIHQKLYRSNMVTSISMPEYITEVVDHLKDGFKVQQSIRFTLQVEKIDLDVLYATPVGLILNEAITNAIKYAFPYGEDDRIAISLFFSGMDEITLIVSDNGRGLPSDFDPDRGGSFGMVLIKGLIRDMMGTLDLRSVNGTTLHMVFKIEKPAINNQYNSSN